MATKQNLSLKGYDFRVWLKKNKRNIKFLVAALAGIATNASAGLGPGWNAVAGVTVALVANFTLDLVDFFASQVEIDDGVTRL